jgi:hypothetical protein
MQIVSEKGAIKLIGDSFYFHVAHIFKRELENAEISTVFHIKKMLEYNFR